MTAKVLMFQGTGSDVGKSTIVAGLCRLARDRGIRVAPFKPQNMSNNAAACPGGGEIGRAQALQALAAGLDLHTDFNPVLLKPQSDMSAQVVVHGKVIDTFSASTYMKHRRAELLSAVMESFERLVEQYDLVLVEGAGSPAEVNLRAGDIANMGFAVPTSTPVCLIGDIDRGGVIAAVAGTKAVLSTEDADQICSFLINRFRGDPSLFIDGMKIIEQRSGWPCRGVLPWTNSALKLPQEDAVVLQQPLQAPPSTESQIKIAVPMLSRIANFDDFDPLRFENSVDLQFVPPDHPIPLYVDAIVIPGTKSTIDDLAFLREQGWDHDILAFARSGGHVTGLCGGYQILGNEISDPYGVEGSPSQVKALGLLDVETTLQKDKTTEPVNAVCNRSGHQLRAYEIHCGKTAGPATNFPMFTLKDGSDGAVDSSGKIEGTYLHGLFVNDRFRASWLEKFNRSGIHQTHSSYNYSEQVQKEIDNLARDMEISLDIEKLLNDAKFPKIS